MFLAFHEENDAAKFFKAAVVELRTKRSSTTSAPNSEPKTLFLTLSRKAHFLKVTGSEQWSSMMHWEEWMGWQGVPPCNQLAVASADSHIWAGFGAHFIVSPGDSWNKRHGLIWIHLTRLRTIYRNDYHIPFQIPTYPSIFSYAHRCGEREG